MPVVDLLSSISEESEIPEPPTGIFHVSRLKGIPEGNKTPNTPILSISRSGNHVGFGHDDNVHPAFTFGQVQISRPQAISSMTLTPLAWPPPPKLMQIYGDAIIITRSASSVGGDVRKNG